jgi:hypothetical protein
MNVLCRICGNLKPGNWSTLICSSCSNKLNDSLEPTV